MKLWWTFENCPCWDEARKKAAEIGWPLEIKERYNIEATSSSDVPVAGRVTCANCGSVRAGTAQMNWSSY